MPRHPRLVFASLVIALFLLLAPSAAHANQPLTIAAASDLRFALDEIIEEYEREHPDDAVRVTYGSSGRMTTQIMNGAPYDVFFSADIAYPQKLRAEGHAVTEPEVYAIGRIVLWSNRMDASELTLEDLTRDDIRRVAIASPTHAPYGVRAMEALQAAGVWDDLQPKIVNGDNIAQTARMVQAGGADIGIIALSLAEFPDLAEHPHHLIDDALHDPLTQGFVITRRGADKDTAHRFAEYMNGDTAREIMRRYGFVMPGDELPDDADQ
ncbi:molybdate transport system substrate-binding protein [Thioalkalivibrio sp. ALE21]|uniref:molybdate ABC transporter substrate-binding protein n=1 Tax=Thioalkalivibrio sp. ALE21 TaxID=1158175 RepID=UPI000D87D5CF|nr:molybdate ABC transporter substrate-binding protein [Thioalkalivibrio sp. ALE21]PYF99453.1 molybdate transport system substrate-binding protein [Thioalkalivibrio sp. ALE21]